MGRPDSIGRRIVFTGRRVQSRFEAVLAGAGSSRPTWAVLSQVVSDAGLTQRELADRLGLEAPTLVRHLDRLCAEGLVTRQPDPSDRRVTRIAPTESGAACQAELARVAARLDERLRDALGPAGANLLTQLLDRIDTYLKETSPDADTCA